MSGDKLTTAEPTDGDHPQKTTNLTEDNSQNIVVVDIGKRSAKQVRKLRKGQGKLLDRVRGLVSEMQSEGTIDAKANTLVVVVERRPEATGFFGS